MKALIDGDILKYEVGWGAEVGWANATGNPLLLPSFDFVKDLLTERIDRILSVTKSKNYCIYLTDPSIPIFRSEVAVTKPYKGTRKDIKPFHFTNLYVYMMHNLPCKVSQKIEADDQMAIDHNEKTIICSRDKDLKQVPGWYYSWELGNQPSFGPVFIEDPGTLNLSEDGKKLSGTGYVWFLAQMIMGDPADNIPGLKGWGHKRAYEFLNPILEMDPDNMEEQVRDLYLELTDEDYYNEQKQLLWILRE